jgi:hypothetical protein
MIVVEKGPGAGVLHDQHVLFLAHPPYGLHQPDVELMRAVTRQSRWRDTRRPRYLTDQQRAQLEDHPELEEARRNLSKIRAQYEKTQAASSFATVFACFSPLSPVAGFEGAGRAVESSRIGHESYLDCAGPLPTPPCSLESSNGRKR